ncbi:MAG: LemA family protein [Bdellovibrionota bacterium]|jgi:LemA protein
MSLTAGIVIAIVIILLYIIWIYNSLIRKRNLCVGSWSQIKVQLKRRHDLIPNVIEVAKGYASHEKETFEAVIAARNAATTVTNSQNIGQQIQAENALSGALRQLFALSESYPDLKANTVFLQLQEELRDTEDKISLSRRQYNNQVVIYNTAIQQFPDVLIANLFNFREQDLFELDQAEEKEVYQAPKVQF